MEIPRRFFHFLRTGDPRPLEAVLEHNRLDLVSLAAVTGHALRLARGGDRVCRDEAEALALGRVLERARVLDRAEACYRRAAAALCVDVRAEALYRLGLRYRRERRFDQAAASWREIVSLTEQSSCRRREGMRQLRQFALEALAIHQEHRERDLDAARELALFALTEQETTGRVDGLRHRLARLDRKLARKQKAGFLWG
jgi:tetratricopeptide (TPR) repeat protein